MQDTVQKLLDPMRGVLAADESDHTIAKRFGDLGIESTPETHRIYRQMLFAAPDIEKYLSGAILFDETARQSTDDGVPFPEYLTKKGIIPGIKVDRGLEKFNGTDETITRTNDGLGERLKVYAEMGLKFTKWRAAFKISDIFPTDALLEEDLSRMAEYAKIAQDNGFVPFVEPEVLLTGNHTTTRCELVETKVLQILFKKLKEIEVDFQIEMAPVL